MKIQSNKQTVIVALLAALMAATRYHHFGSAQYLPDASLAVFFLAGVYLPMRWLMPVLLLEAGLIDYLAIHVGGVSDWCVSPAYWYLIPTYACLWYGGRWYAARLRLSLRSFGLLFVTLFVTTSLAFLISNGSFYLFSGRYATLDWAQYGARIAAYYLPYLTSAFVYVACAAVLHGLLAALHATRSPRIDTGLSGH